MSTFLSFLRVSDGIEKTSVLSTPADPDSERTVQRIIRYPLAIDRHFNYYALAR